MADLKQIQFKRSSTAGAIPTTTDIAAGEFAVNLTDKILYTSNGTTIINLTGLKDGNINENINVTGTGTFSGFVYTPRLNTRKSDNTSYTWDDRSTAAASSKKYMRFFCSHSSGTLWHETVEGNVYRLAQGSTDTTEILRIDAGNLSIINNITAGKKLTSQTLNVEGFTPTNGNGLIIVDTSFDSNGIGNGKTLFGYNINGVTSHYFRGTGLTRVETLGGLQVSLGGANILGGLSVTGATTLTGTLSVVNDVTLTGALSVGNSFSTANTPNGLYSWNDRSAETTNTKRLMRTFRSSATATIWSETVNGDIYRIATGSSDNSELLRLENNANGLVLTNGLSVNGVNGISATAGSVKVLNGNGFSSTGGGVGLTTDGTINLTGGTITSARINFIKGGAIPSNMSLFYAGDADRGPRLEIADEGLYIAYFENNPSTGRILQVNGRVVPVDYSNFDSRFYTQAQTYTRIETDAKYIQGIRRGARQTSAATDGVDSYEAPQGYITGLNNTTGDGNVRYSTWYYRTPQVLLNGTWVNITNQ